MADSTFEFSPSARLQILNILPQKAGSLRESIQVKRLRDRINFSDEEKDQIGFDESTGGFNPRKLDELGDMELQIGQDNDAVMTIKKNNILPPRPPRIDAQHAHKLIMADTNLTNRLREMRDKYRRKAREAKTENLRHRFEGMADAYENAIELAEVTRGNI